MKNKFFIKIVILLLPLWVFLSSCNKEKCKKDVTEKVYVANEDDGSISVFDAETCENLETVDLGKMNMMYMPHNLQVAPDQKSIWVTANDMNDANEDQILLLYPHGDRVNTRIDCGKEQHLAHVVLDESSAFAYATTNEGGDVIQIDADKKSIKNRFPLRAGCTPHGMRMINGKLWIATMSAPGLIRLDPSTGDTLCINMNGIGVQTACRNAGDFVFVSLYDRCGVMRYNIATGDTLFIPLPSSAQGPIQIWMTPNDSMLLVCDQGMLNGKPAGNKLYIIYPVSGTVADSVTVGSGPHGVCTNFDGTRAYVTNTNANTMCMIDLTSKTVLKTVSTGAKPNGISFLLCP